MPLPRLPHLPPALDCWRKSWKREGTAEDGETNGESIYIYPHTTGGGSFNVSAIVVCVCVCFSSRPSLSSSPRTQASVTGRSTPAMKSTFAAAALTALAARQVAGHAMFQQLWVDGTDYISLSFSTTAYMTARTNSRSTVLPAYACPRPTPPSPTSRARISYATRAAARASRASAPLRPGRR